MSDFTACVVVVDDRNEDRRELCDRFTQAANQQNITLDVREATDGLGAIVLAQSCPCDLFVIDYDLGDGMTGVEVIEAIKRMHSGVRLFVLVSGYNERVTFKRVDSKPVNSSTRLFVSKQTGPVSRLCRHSD